MKIGKAEANYLVRNIDRASNKQLASLFKLGCNLCLGTINFVEEENMTPAEVAEDRGLKITRLMNDGSVLAVDDATSDIIMIALAKGGPRVINLSELSRDFDKLAKNNEFSE